MERSVSRLLGEKGNDIWSISPGSSVFEAITIMAEKGVGALLVMEGDYLCGIISERDYTRKVILKGRASKDCRVSEIMTSRVICVDPEWRVEDCMSLMTEKRVRHLPVVKDNKVLGVLSIGDVVRSLIKQKSHMIEKLESYILGH
ncbi:MAG: CBS domain-containing protein [Deltaproteobacteria bacterium]|nr:CBS domain-containing protein [Deltaproteobacteria bacterium]